jgi:hypothetical protein
MSVIFDDALTGGKILAHPDTEKRIDKLEVDDESHKATLVYLNSASRMIFARLKS